MATTTIGELLLHMEVDGDKQVITALQRYLRTSQQVNSANKNMRTSSNNLNGSLKNIGVSFSDIFKTLGAYAIVDTVADSFGYLIDKLKDGVKAGINYNSNIEYLTASITALVGSEDRAVSLTSELVTLAAETPFSIEHYAKATKTLLGYGVATEDIIPTIEMLGDVAMGDTVAFDRLALAYGQTTAKGKLQAEEVRQMVNQGFNPLKFIVEETGIEMEDLADKMRAGEITTEMVTKAFERATSEGGRFDGMMEALSKTYKGQSEKIKEYGEIFWGKVTKPLYDILASKVFPFILENIKALTEGVDILYGQFGIVVPKIVEFMKAFKTGDIEDLYNALKNLIPKDYEDKLVPATVATLKVRDALIWLKDKAFIAFEYLKENGRKAFNFWETQVKAKVLPIIEDLIDQIGKMDWTEAKESLDRLKEAFILAEPYLKMFARFTIREVIDMAKGMWNLIKDMAKDIPEEFSLMLDGATMFLDAFTLGASIFKGDTDSMKSSSKHLKDTFIDYVGKMSDFTAMKLGLMGTNLLITVRDMNRDSNTYMGKMVADSIDKFLSLASHSKQTWNSLQYAISLIIGRLLSDTKDRIGKIKSFIVSAWNSIKTTTSSVWNSAVNVVTTAMVSFYKAVYDKIQAIKNAFKSFKETAKSILNFSLYTAGSNLIGTFISGIYSKFSALRSAVSAGATIVKNFFGFSSPTKEGAGRTADKWIPNLIDMMISDFKSGEKKIASASSALSEVMRSSLSINSSASSAISGTSGIVNNGWSTSNSINVVINADSYTNGSSVGRQLVTELNRLGVLTHK